MKAENKALIKSLLDQSEFLQEDIYADCKQMLCALHPAGHSPPPMSHGSPHLLVGQATVGGAG